MGHVLDTAVPCQLPEVASGMVMLACTQSLQMLRNTLSVLLEEMSSSSESSSCDPEHIASSDGGASPKRSRRMVLTMVMQSFAPSAPDAY